MKVLVTGASGRLGPYVVAELEKAGHELVPVSYTHLTLPTSDLV